MKSSNKHILIEKKLSGKLNEQETNEFNRLMAEDAFFKESMEGYQEMESDGSELLESDLRWKTARNTRIITWTGVSIAAAFALFFIVNGGFNDPKALYTPDQNTGLAESYYGHVPPIIIQPENDTIEDSEESSDQNIDEFIAENSSNELPEELPPMFRIQPHTIQQLKEEKSIESWTAQSNHLYGYIHSFKFVDYRIDRRKNHTDFTIPTNQVSEQFENTIETSHQVAYIDFLEQALLKFKNENYDAALDDFRTILNQYPEDVNALFYAGLCHYHSDRPERCIPVMERVFNHEINTFHEDAQWYQALACKEENLYDETVRLLTAISQSNSHYGAMASDELNQLNNLK